MALESDLMSCLEWVIEERPCIETLLQSSYFHLCGEEWYIKMSFSQVASITPGFNRSEYNGCVFLVSKNGDQVFGDLEKIFALNSGSEILSFHIPFEDFYPFKRSSERWKVCVRMSCVQPVPIRINNETILLSTRPLPTSPDPSVQTCAEFPPDLQRLSDDFSRLLDKEIIPDAKLTCCGRTWNVHRSILTARSEVFAAMFGSGMVESETGAVRIEDLEPPVLDSLLKYVYSGKVLDVSGENVSSVYEAADRYALHGLKEACSHWMAKELSRENCLGFLVVADAHGDDGLKEAALSFITKHFAQIERAIWANFRNAHSLLAIEVLERFAPLMEE